MQDEWIPFLEAIHRMHDRLFMADFRAKPLLRSAVASGRVCGRGEHRERGQIIFTRYGENLDNDPNVIHEGSLCYKAEVYPGEVVLAELRSWMESLSDDSQRPLIVPPQQIASPQPAELTAEIPAEHQATMQSLEARAPLSFTRKRRPQEQERVLPVLLALFPDGVPLKEVLTNSALAKAVADHMDKVANAKNQRGYKAPSRETILRAAGRK